MHVMDRMRPAPYVRHRLGNPHVRPSSQFKAGVPSDAPTVAVADRGDFHA